MTAKQNHPEELLLEVQRERNELAKRYARFSVIFEIIVLGIGFVISLTNFQPTWLALVAGILLIAAFVCQIYSDYLKEISQDIERKYEFWEALGWPVSAKELSDIKQNLPQQIREKIETSAGIKDWFASKEPIGERRLVENLTQNSWWSKHIARKTFQYYIFFTVVVFLGGIILLIFALQAGLDPTTSNTVAKIIIAIFVFMFSAGHLRVCLEYWRFSQAADRIEERAFDLLKTDQVDKDQAIKLYHDYQTARAISPLLPTWIYKQMNPGLEADWEKYRK